MRSAPHPVTMHRIAWICVMLMLIVTSASAWLRLAQQQPRCDDWPVCRAPPAPGARAGAAERVAAGASVSTVRVVHRGAASAALLCIVLLVLSWLRGAPPGRARDALSGALTLALLCLGLALSALGIVTPGSRASAVLLGNLLGGLLMLALAWRLTRHLGGAASHDPGHGLDGWALAGALLWSVQSALGALSGSGGTLQPALWHGALALAPGFCALMAGRSACRYGLPAEGRALVAVVAAQWMLGGAAVLFQAAAPGVLLHNLTAALGLALLLGLIGRAGRTHGARAAA